MAPIEFEENIREKLQERELQPSADAWSQLESRLGEEKKSGPGKGTWFAIAASFIGILILASVFLNNNVITGTNELVTDETPTIEASDIETPKNKQDEFIRLNNNNNEVAIDETVSEENKEKERVEVDPEPSLKMVAGTNMPNNITSAVIAITKDEKEKNVTEDKAIKFEVLDETTFIKSKVDEVVAQVQNNKEVTPEDIDALLMKAQREISARRILNSQTNKVDAAALLMDVELELERSFRDKVFDALGEGYKKIRTAVVERNH